MYGAPSIVHVASAHGGLGATFSRVQWGLQRQGTRTVGYGDAIELLAHVLCPTSTWLTRAVCSCAVSTPAELCEQVGGGALGAGGGRRQRVGRSLGSSTPGRRRLAAGDVRMEPNCHGHRQAQLQLTQPAGKQAAFYCNNLQGLQPTVVFLTRPGQCWFRPRFSWCGCHLACMPRSQCVTIASCFLRWRRL